MNTNRTLTSPAGLGSRKRKDAATCERRAESRMAVPHPAPASTDLEAWARAARGETS